MFNQLSVKKESGATMIEIMISILVFSVGLLGIASTQTLGLTNTQSALNRSYATQMAYELVDIMRINRAISGQAGFAAGNLFDTFNTTQNHGLVIDDDCRDEREQCTEQEMVGDALARWEERVEGILPDGQALITQNVPPGGDGNFLLVITWVDLKLEQEQDAAAAQAREDVNGNLANNIYRFELEFRI